MKVNIDVNNVSEGYGEPYIVARLVDGTLWYFGRYGTEKKAKIVAANFNNAIVMEVAE